MSLGQGKLASSKRTPHSTYDPVLSFLIVVACQLTTSGHGVRLETLQDWVSTHIILTPSAALPKPSTENRPGYVKHHQLETSRVATQIGSYVIT